MAGSNLENLNGSDNIAILDNALLLAQESLGQWARGEDFLAGVKFAFGDNFNPAKLEVLRQQWASGQFEALPTIEIRPAAEINGAIGAFSADTNRIYLSQELIEQNISASQAITDVLLEEIGHFVDAEINELDAPGDEGEFFSALIQREKLSESKIKTLKDEVDSTTLILDGKAIAIEQASNTDTWIIKWRDKGRNLWPVRESTVNFLEVESKRKIGSTTTDLQGHFSFGSTVVPSEIILEILPNRTFSGRETHLVSDGAKIFSSEARIRTDDKKRDIELSSQSKSEKAFSINDALFVGEQYVKTVRAAIDTLPISELPKLTSVFPGKETGYGSNGISIDSNDWSEWDSIHHEYGHFLADNDKLDSGLTLLDPPHQPGLSGISQLESKLNGIQVGWSEGLAIYLSQAIQEVAHELNVLPNVPGVNDIQVYYNVPPLLGIPRQGKFSIETVGQGEGYFQGIGRGEGEGDELSVARILWDLTDGIREPYDQISIPHKELYRFLRDTTIKLDLLENHSLNRLDDIWDSFHSRFSLSNPAELAKYGAIFENNGVSPRPLELANISTSGTPLIFSWERGNEVLNRKTRAIFNANDEFETIIFDSQFNRILTSGLLKQGSNWTDRVATWTPSQSQWNQILGRGLGQKYYFVVSGSDTRIDNNLVEPTGPYWSNAYTFQVGDVAPKNVQFGALLDKGLNKLSVFQSSTNQLATNLPLLRNALQPSRGAAPSPTSRVSQLGAANAVSTDTEMIQTQALLSEISPIAETIGLNFLGNLSEKIKTKFSQKFGKATEATVDQIQDAFFELLGSNGAFGSAGILKDSNDPGDDITKEDIDLIIDGSIVQFNIKLGGHENLADISLPSDIGLPWLGFEFNDPNNPNSSTPKAGIDLDYTFDLGFGIDTTTNDFFFETSPNKDLTISLTPSFPDATARLGFLQVNAQNKGSKIEFSVDIDDGEDGNDQLTIAELNQENWRFTPTGSADINFHLDSSIAGSTLLPSIGADLNLNWNFTQDDASPAVDFNNVELKLGTFFKNFAGPVFQQVQKVIEPIQPLIDVLDKRVPVLDTFGRGFLDVTGEEGKPDGKVTLLDIVKLREPNAKTAEFLAAAKKASDFIKTVDEFSKQDATIKLGQFDFGDFNISDPTFDRKTINLEATSEEEDVIAQLKSLSPGLVTFANDITTPSGPQFPILTDPTQAFKLILGQPAELFKYNVPELRFNFGFEQFFPIIGPLGALIEGNLGARVKLALGFDTYGLEQTGNPLDGFYIGNKPDPFGPGGLLDPSKGRESGAELFAGLNAAAAFSASIAKAGVGGGILGTLNLFLHDLNHDGDSTKVHLDEFDPSCIFDPVTGNLSASLNAFIKVGFGFFSYTKRFNIAKATLLDFAVGCTTHEKNDPLRNDGLATLLTANSLTEKDLRFNLKDGDLRLNMGSDFATFRLIGGKAGTDEAEVFSVNYKSGIANNATLEVSGFDVTREYSNIQRIVAFTGKENDTVVIADAVFTPASLEGGAGNDQLYGGSGDDILKGETGDDALFGGKGDDDLSGGEGDDYLEGGAGADTLDGGSNSDNKKGGGDTVSYKDSPVGVRFRVDPSNSSFFIGSGGDAQGDTLKNIEHVEGSDFDDRLLGDNSRNTLEGLRGNDTLEGGGGDDILLGGVGADRLDGGDGRDWTGYIASSAEVKINLETGEASSGDAEGDTLISVEDVKGSIHNDILIGSRADNHLDGFFGDDRIIGGGGADILDGGDGQDWVSYETSKDGVNVSLKTGGSVLENPNTVLGVRLSQKGLGGDAQGDKLEKVKVKDQNGKEQETDYNSFENLEGSLGNDTLEGDIGNNIIKGLGGKDILKGDDGNDILSGNAGADHLDGGNGIDWADYSDSPSAVSVSLKTNVSLGGDAEGDTFEKRDYISTVENLLGSDFADTLEGDAGDNEINPGLGNGIDKVNGQGGSDLLVIDYSFRDEGRGIEQSGFFSGSTTSGFLFRSNEDNTAVLDAVSFTNIERLKVIGTIKNDQIFGGAGDDILLPGAGNDIIYGGRGSNIIDANDGDDFVVDQNDVNRKLEGTPNINTIQLDGGRGVDTLSVDLSAFENNITLASANLDQEDLSQNFTLSNGSAIKNFEIFKDIKTGFGNDRLIQIGRIDNKFSTGGGDDLINPGLGLDVVDGGFAIGDGVMQGDDLLIVDYSVEDIGTGIFADVARNLYDGSFSASEGGRFYRNISETDYTRLDEVAFKNFERFIITGTSKGDRLIGGDGADILRGQSGKDTLYGGLGNDSLFGGDGDDLLLDGDDFPNRDDATSVQVRSGGNDISRGGNGNDILNGLSGDDGLFGEAGNDSLFGGEGSDILDGGEGNDILNGFSLFSSQESKDILTGGLGADEFHLGDKNHIYYTDNNFGSLDNESFARITDFNPSEGDILQLHGSADDYSFFISPTSTSIYLGRFGFDYPNPDLIAILEGVSIDLSTDHIHFVDSANFNQKLTQNTNEIKLVVPAVTLYQDSEKVITSLDQFKNQIAQDQGKNKAITELNKLEEKAPVPVSSQNGNNSAEIPAQSQVLESVFDLTQSNNSQQLLKNLLGDATGLSNFKVELVGDGRAFGTFKNDPFGLGSGVAISTGRVIDLAGSNSIDGGFTPSDEKDLSQDFAEKGTAGDSISLKIEFDADATKDHLFFQYVFGSEEFAEFGDSSFNDNFSLTLNGFNLARLTDGSTVTNGSTVSINNLVPSPLGSYHPDFIYNPTQVGPASGETKLDGYTKPLLLQADLVQNGHNTLVINVQDVNDALFDSAVFIKGGTLGTKFPLDNGGTSGGPILDLTNQTGRVNLEFQVTRDAGFNNLVRFYEIDDTLGTVNGVSPDDPTYTAAAVSKLVDGLKLTGLNEHPVLSSATLEGGKRYAPVLFQNGSLATPFFSFTPANPDGAEHVQSSQEGIFNFEDLTGGGDQDFNDLVVQVKTADNSNSKPLPELLDLTGFDNGVLVGIDATLARDAGFSNILRFYATDAQGRVNGQLPGSPGYEDAVRSNLFNGVELQGVDKKSLPIDFSLKGGGYYGLALAVNGNLNDLVTLDDAVSGSSARLRGSNNSLFEFEDSNDFDFNDMVLTVNQVRAV